MGECRQSDTLEPLLDPRNGDELWSKGMNSRTSRRKTVISQSQAVSLLYPIAAFFNSGRMSKKQSLAAFNAATDYVTKAEGRRELEHIGAPTCYLDLIAIWARDPKFLDPRGRPRALPFSGANGFAALVKRSGTRRDPKKLLGVLMRFKNVRRLSDGRIRLVSPLFRASAGSRMAFEPIVYFMNDAASTLTYTLKNITGSAEPDLFWRTVESAQISKADAGKFMQFAKERSLLFLEEMDDWLQAHASARKPGSKKQLRVGLGMFSIYSQPHKFRQNDT
jgi:Family of unknown function (DUF6502)